MRRLLQITTLMTVLVVLAVPAFSDTLILKSGERVSGYFEGGTARVVKFRASDGLVKDYDILSVQQVQFGDDKSSSSTPVKPATSAPSSSVTSSSQPRLLPADQRVTQPTSSTAANTAFTIPTGSKITIRMIDSVNSEKNKVGESFVAVLDEPLSQGGLEVIPRGADVRGRIANINEAGRVAGSAQLGLELTQINVNGIPYSVTTSEYNEVGEGRGTDTAKKVGVGAGAGAIIGAIVGGKKGAAIGAGVGGGGATAVQVMTKGEKLNIPSETKLEFTLRTPLVVAGR
jgi:hypothetical protein